MAWVTVMTVNTWTCVCGEEIIRSRPKTFKWTQDEHIERCPRYYGWQSDLTPQRTLVAVRHPTWWHPDLAVQALKTAAAPVFDGSRKH